MTDTDAMCLVSVPPAIAEACMLLPVSEAASLLYEELTPYEGYVPVLAVVYVHGAVAHELRELSAALSRSDKVHHLERVLKTNRRIRDRHRMARTQAACAGLRAARSNHEGSSRLLADAGTTVGPQDVLGSKDARRLLTDSATTRAHADALLRLDGGYWSVEHRGCLVRLRDSKGLRYLAELVARPGVERHVLDLVGLVEAPAEPGLDRRALGDAGPLLDAQAKAAYKRRLVQLHDEVEEAEQFGDEAGITRAQAEIDALAAELARAVGLGGRDRRAASAAEKARLNVTRALRAAITHISKVHPELGVHLDRCVLTGRFCSYDPGPHPAVIWQSQAVQPTLESKQLAKRRTR
jgi:hypothetical protein